MITSLIHSHCPRVLLNSAACIPGVERLLLCTSLHDFRLRSSTSGLLETVEYTSDF